MNDPNSASIAVGRSRETVISSPCSETTVSTNISIPRVFIHNLTCHCEYMGTVFHQADGAGNPVMDMGHVIMALNKLDAADEEKIVLTSRDGKSMMVVSYADVARCLDSAYHELCAGSVVPQLAPPY